MIWPFTSAPRDDAAVTEPVAAPAPIVPAEPRYRLLAKAYLPEGAGDSRIHRVGEVVVHHGVPAHYMLPLNTAAHEMVDRHANTLAAKRSTLTGVQ